MALTIISSCFSRPNGYRGIKVNNPQNLSSFYLPNSQLYFGATLLGSGPAIVLAPVRCERSEPARRTRRFFRPAFNQPFVQFPFVGGVGPNFGVAPGTIIWLPPVCQYTLARLVAVNSGNFGAA